MNDDKQEIIIKRTWFEQFLNQMQENESINKDKNAKTVTNVITDEEKIEDEDSHSSIIDKDSENIDSDFYDSISFHSSGNERLDDIQFDMHLNQEVFGIEECDRCSVLFLSILLFIYLYFIVIRESQQILSNTAQFIDNYSDCSLEFSTIEELTKNKVRTSMDSVASDWTLSSFYSDFENLPSFAEIEDECKEEQKLQTCNSNDTLISDCSSSYISYANKPSSAIKTPLKTINELDAESMSGSSVYTLPSNVNKQRNAFKSAIHAMNELPSTPSTFERMTPLTPVTINALPIISVSSTNFTPTTVTTNDRMFDNVNLYDDGSSKAEYHSDEEKASMTDDKIVIKTNAKMPRIIDSVPHKKKYFQTPNNNNHQNTTHTLTLSAASKRTKNSSKKSNATTLSTLPSLPSTNRENNTLLLNITASPLHLMNETSNDSIPNGLDFNQDEKYLLDHIAENIFNVILAKNDSFVNILCCD